MRVGDFGVELVPVNASSDHTIREIESGHVLARPGTVYMLRLRNFGPLRCVAEVSIDGTLVTESSLVLDAWSTTQLERPINDSESGRFTVIAEGDERAFGPDGGRDNRDLGVVEVRFRRELPTSQSLHQMSQPDFPSLPLPRRGPDAPSADPRSPLPPGRPMAPPDWNPPGFRSKSRRQWPDILASAREVDELDDPYIASHSFDVDDVAERAAGTGLTGHSMQSFIPVMIGTLEQEATVIRLRIVIGTEEALAAPRPLPTQQTVPERPAARP